jgi:hypothetical protein
MNQSKTEIDIKHICAICTKRIDDEVKSVAITVQLEDGGTQTFNVHKKCLKEVLHPSVPIVF